MPARACRSCGLSFGNSPEFNPCPVCGSETVYDKDAEPDADIEVAVKAALHVPPGRRSLLMWRRRQFVSLGFAGAILDLLVESPVDAHELRLLVARGCPSETAAEILL